MQGNLLFLRGVPPQVETGGPRPDVNWGLLFAEAGLDKTQFVPASPKWAPPDSFDSRADWEGHLPDRPDVLIHVTAAAYHGAPVYFQLIAPWDQPWRGDPSTQSRMPAASGILLSTAWPLLMAGYLLVAGFFARRNVRRGRGDAKGALRLASFAILANCIYGFFVYHYVPQAEYISVQFILLGAPLLFALLAWLGYMAVEPYGRQSWPRLMVSWQRLLNGRLRDPLVGRDVLLGIVAGSAMGTIFLGCRGVFAQLGSVPRGRLFRSRDPAVRRPLLPVAFCRILLRSFLLCHFVRHDWPVAAAKVRTGRHCTYHAAAECANHCTGFHFDRPVRACIPGSAG